MEKAEPSIFFKRRSPRRHTLSQTVRIFVFLYSRDEGWNTYRAVSVKVYVVNTEGKCAFWHSVALGSWSCSGSPAHLEWLISKRLNLQLRLLEEGESPARQFMTLEDFNGLAAVMFSIRYET